MKDERTYCPFQEAIYMLRSRVIIIIFKMMSVVVKGIHRLLLDTRVRDEGKVSQSRIHTNANISVIMVTLSLFSLSSLPNATEKVE